MSQLETHSILYPELGDFISHAFVIHRHNVDKFRKRFKIIRPRRQARSYLCDIT